jgi:predicted alpha/beta hydrolase family esterase
MKQVLIIHGGTSFNSYEQYINSLKSNEIDYQRLKPQNQWKQWISDQMTDIDVLLPRFPNSNNAVYNEWKIYFEKLIPFLGNDVQLIGHSLGAMFLAKYLHEMPLRQKVRRLILISGVYDNDYTGDNGSFLVNDAKGLEQSADEIHLFHSEDDPVVPFSELAKFQADLPSAITHVFSSRGHFNDETFPELLEILEQK